MCKETLKWLPQNEAQSACSAGILSISNIFIKYNTISFHIIAYHIYSASIANASSDHHNVKAKRKITLLFACQLHSWQDGPQAQLHPVSLQAKAKLLDCAEENISESIPRVWATMVKSSTASAGSNGSARWSSMVLKRPEGLFVPQQKTVVHCLSHIRSARQHSNVPRILFFNEERRGIDFTSGVYIWQPTRAIGL